MLTFIGLAALSMTLMAGDKGPTVVVKKDERRIAGLNTNGVTDGRPTWVKKGMR